MERRTVLRTPRMELTTELAGALVNWHDSSPDAHLHHELWAYAAVPSVASQRVLSKVGFEFVGYRDHHATVCPFSCAPLRCVALDHDAATNLLRAPAGIGPRV